MSAPVVAERLPTIPAQRTGEAPAAMRVRTTVYADETHQLAIATRALLNQLPHGAAIYTPDPSVAFDTTADGITATHYSKRWYATNNGSTVAVIVWCQPERTASGGASLEFTLVDSAGDHLDPPLIDAATVAVEINEDDLPAAGEGRPLQIIRLTRLSSDVVYPTKARRLRLDDATPGGAIRVKCVATNVRVWAMAVQEFSA